MEGLREALLCDLAANLNSTSEDNRKAAEIIWAHGVVVSHPLRTRKALGSNPSVSILQTCPHHTDRTHIGYEICPAFNTM